MLFRSVFRNRVVELDAAQARMTLLDWLRLVQGATGTKEGCAEGDCGACTVVLARRKGDRIVHEPVNACILLAGQADGAQVFTVEDLAKQPDALHPVQDAMVRHHGSQCGFCTPGIVMSLYAMYHEGARPPSRAAVCDQLAGNLCRCTGYRPIIAAALEACAGPPPAIPAAVGRQLDALDDEDDVFAGDDAAFFAAPRTEETLARLLTRHPDALVVAGATDAGLWLTKGLLAPARITALWWRGICWRKPSPNSPARRPPPRAFPPTPDHAPMPPNDMQSFDEETAGAPRVVAQPHPQDSARLHVMGAAAYIDDLREPAGTLHVACACSPAARGALRGLRVEDARATPGVVAVIGAADIPGRNDIAPLYADEPLFAEGRVLFHGQPLCAVVAQSREAARRSRSRSRSERIRPATPRSLRWMRSQVSSSRSSPWTFPTRIWPRTRSISRTTRRASASRATRSGSGFSSRRMTGSIS